MKRRFAAPLIFATVVVASLTVVLPAYAWQNGREARGHGRLTAQQWILAAADRLAASAGADWLDLHAASAAIPLPDTRFHDFRYHYYDRWGAQQGGQAPQRIAADYHNVVVALVNGDTVGASRWFGLMAHYYTDIADPLHTDNSRAEQHQSLHRHWEQHVMSELNRGGDASTLRVNAIAGFPVITESVSRFAVDTATAAHREYWPLVHDYGRRNDDATVSRVTSATMQRAVEGVAGLIVLATKDRGIVLATKGRDRHHPHGNTPTPSPRPSARRRQCRAHAYGHGDSGADPRRRRPSRTHSRRRRPRRRRLTRSRRRPRRRPPPP